MKDSKKIVRRRHSARLNGHDPFAYLRNVLERLPTRRPAASTNCCLTSGSRPKRKPEVTPSSRRDHRALTKRARLVGDDWRKPWCRGAVPDSWVIAWHVGGAHDTRNLERP